MDRCLIIAFVFLFTGLGMIISTFSYENPRLRFIDCHGNKPGVFVGCVTR